jgi:DNA mismatch endonuclease, patch repair protein
MDIVDKKKRSEMMSRVRSCNTAPEVRARKILHCLGYRFLLHRKDLPGTPDIVLSAYNSVVFVHGCFWHRHEGCRDATTPRTRRRFWQKKFAENIARDRRNVVSLRKLGWRLLIIWECELRDEAKLIRKLVAFLK